jgi:hypothetical protein
LQKTQSKIETTEKEKDSCFYKINKFMIFACFNLIGQFLAVFLLDLKEFLWIHITQIICLLFYFFTLFYIKLTECDCLSLRLRDRLNDFLKIVEFMQQICSVAISVLTVVEIFIPIIKYGISKHIG